MNVRINRQSPNGVAPYNMLASKSDDHSRRLIRYEFGQEPDIGQSIPIVPGLRWLRMPLPFMLGHINLWLLQDGSEWTIVDTGLHTQISRDHWQDVLTRQLHSQAISRIVVTHLHPDHSGCAGWLAERCHAPLWMTGEEYLLCRVLVADTGEQAPAEAIRFYSAAGFSDEAIERYKKAFGHFGRMVAELPQSFRRLRDGMPLQIGEWTWQVLVGRGHSVEHACLYCAETNTLISGDQLLPTISSNVSVFPTEPEANPLADWFESLDMLKRVLPHDVLVLPAHGKPFRGAHIRADELIREHQEGLDRLRSLCRQPVRAIDTFSTLFKSTINENNLIMATGEAIAHLHYLQFRGEVRSWYDDDAVRWYQVVS